MRPGLKALFAIAGSITGSLAAQAADLPGYERLEVSADHRSRDLDAAIWYPAEQDGYRTLIGDNAVFHGTRAYQGTAVRRGLYPLIFISHGSGGNIQNLGWLAGGLALNGAMVVGVNHPGSTTGDSSPRRSIRHWERPMDIGATLTAVMNDPAFGPSVDRSRISVIGFSLGGLTALSLGGARPDKDKFLDYCVTLGAAALDCVFFKKGGVDLSAVPETEFEQDLRDPRISGIVAVDPAFGYGFSDESLARIDIPVHLINLGLAPDRWAAIDSGPSGSRLSTRLPNARYTEVDNANHFTFLGLCKPGARDILVAEGEDPICDGPDGADRGKTHDALIEIIVRALIADPSRPPRKKSDLP